MKYIIIVPDGMSDYPIPELGDKTPLEVANINHMNYMAKHGTTGLVQTIPEGMNPGSDVGNMSILGYDPKKYLTGRAPLEAANQNIDLDEDEIAFRCNLVTITDKKMADYSAGHISTKEASLLIESLNFELDLDNVKFYTGKSYRHLMVMKTNNQKSFLSISTTPPHDIMDQDYSKHLPKGSESAMLLKIMELSKNILENHSVNQVRIDLGENPANMIWLWGQGLKPKLPSFKKRYGIKGSIISAVDLVNGIGKLIGLEVIDVPGITGYYDTNYLGKAEYAIDSLKSNDLVFIHIEAPDEAGHNGDYKAKIEAIEKIDSEIIGTILNHYNEHDDIRILVSPDHPTPIQLRTHSNDPVGFIMYGKGIAHDGSDGYNEKLAKEKGLKFKSGEDLMKFFIKKFI